jgi:hypothetical protein
MITGADDMVEIMGASPDVPAPPGAAAPPPHMIMPFYQKLTKPEKIGAVAVVLLLVGGVAYSMSKKG